MEAYRIREGKERDLSSVARQNSGCHRHPDRGGAQRRTRRTVGAGKETGDGEVAQGGVTSCKLKGSGLGAAHFSHQSSLRNIVLRRGVDSNKTPRNYYQRYYFEDVETADINDNARRISL